MRRGRSTSSPCVIRDCVTSSRTSLRCTWKRPCAATSSAVARISSSDDVGTVARPTRNRLRRDRAAAAASASCSATTCSSGRGFGSSAAPYETSPRSPSRSSPSTTPGVTGSGPGAMHIMSATVVTPDSAISAPRSRVPTSAISRVTHGSSGPVTCTNHSHSVWVSPIPDTSASLKCPWQLTNPGTRIPVPSPTTGASGMRVAQRRERPDGRDPGAGDGHRAVADLADRPAREHVPGPDEPDVGHVGLHDRMPSKPDRRIDELVGHQLLGRQPLLDRLALGREHRPEDLDHAGDPGGVEVAQRGVGTVTDDLAVAHRRRGEAGQPGGVAPDGAGVGLHRRHDHVVGPGRVGRVRHLGALHDRDELRQARGQGVLVRGPDRQRLPVHRVAGVGDQLQLGVVAAPLTQLALVDVGLGRGEARDGHVAAGGDPARRAAVVAAVDLLRCAAARRPAGTACRCRSGSRAPARPCSRGRRSCGRRGASPGPT